MVLQSLRKFIQVYEDVGRITDSFVTLMQRRKAQVMGSDKWVVVKERVTREQANSMFNFKEGLKRKALKVQYFNHPELAHFYMIGSLQPMVGCHGTMRFLIILLGFFMRNCFRDEARLY